MLTPEQREEGRRLLDASDEEGAPLKAIAKAGEWIWDNRRALLADPEIDIEEIKRGAVREFAEAVLVQFDKRAMIWGENHGGVRHHDRRKKARRN